MKSTAAIDDVLVSRESEDAFHVVVNAGNRETVVRPLAGSITVQLYGMEDLTLDQAMIAVQGLEAAGLPVSLGLDSEGLGNYRFRDIKRDGSTIRLSRTGYTGEDGFECFLPSAQAAAFWQEIAATGITLCGLGARDLLRLEAGTPLYGHEIDRHNNTVPSPPDSASPLVKRAVTSATRPSLKKSPTAVNRCWSASTSPANARPGEG